MCEIIQHEIDDKMCVCVCIYEKIVEKNTSLSFPLIIFAHVIMICVEDPIHTMLEYLSPKNTFFLSRLLSLILAQPLSHFVAYVSNYHQGIDTAILQYILLVISEQLDYLLPTMLLCSMCTVDVMFRVCFSLSFDIFIEFRSKM